MRLEEVPRPSRRMRGTADGRICIVGPDEHGQAPQIEVLFQGKVHQGLALGAVGHAEGDGQVPNVPPRRLGALQKPPGELLGRALGEAGAAAQIDACVSVEDGRRVGVHLPRDEKDGSGIAATAPIRAAK